MGKIIFNIFKYGFAIWSGILGVLPHLFRWLGWEDEAMGLDNFGPLLFLKDINWPLIWSVVFTGAVTYGIIKTGLYFNKKSAQKKEMNKREWNTPLPMAIKYIVNRSFFGDNLQDRKDKYRFALSSIEEKFLKGELKISGIPNEASNWQLIPLKIKFLPIIRPNIEFNKSEDNKNDIIKVWLKYGKKGKKTYNSLTVDWNELRKVWPPHNRPDRIY